MNADRRQLGYERRAARLPTPAERWRIPARRLRSVRQSGRTVLCYVFLIIGSVGTLFPLFWMVSTSLKTLEESNAPHVVWLPESPRLDAYSEILSDPIWIRYFTNSFFVTLLAFVGTFLSVSAVAYAFSRIEWPGRNIIFFLMLSTLMLPPQTLIVPQYVLFYKLGWLGTFNPIIIPGFFAGGAIFIFLLRQFMLSIPRELDEAAIIDGASHLHIWWKIILPLCKPALGTIGIFLFVTQWNAFQLPLIYLQRTSLYTLPIAIANLLSPSNSIQPWPTIMAASVLTTIPLLVAFFVAQRYILENITLSGLKG